MNLRYVAHILLPLCLTGSANTQQAKLTPASFAIEIIQVEHERYGFQVTLAVHNNSDQTVYLPVSPYWSEPKYPDPPRLDSLSIVQWSDGKTNLLARGRSASSYDDMTAGFYSVGPCHDIPFDGRWITLPPGGMFLDEIQAFEPGDSYIVSSCPWHHAHLMGATRIRLAIAPARNNRDFSRWIEVESASFDLAATAKP